MAKKYNYNLSISGYGGELVVGKTNKHFVEYWLANLEETESDSDLVEYLVDNEWGEDVPDDALIDPEESPNPNTEDRSYEPGAWHDFDDFEHVYGVYSDNSIQLVTIDEDGNEDYENALDIDLSDVYTLYSRECYTDQTSGLYNSSENYVPIVSFFSAEKGGFGDIALSLDEPFDVSKFTICCVETNLATIVEQYYYDGEPLEVNSDSVSTTGKGYYAQVGYLNTKWHDKVSSYDDMSERIEEWHEYLEYMRTQN